MQEPRSYVNEIMEARGDAPKIAQIIMDFNKYVLDSVKGYPELVRSMTIVRMQAEFEYNLKAAFRSLSDKPLSSNNVRVINQGEQVAPKELVEKLERIINSKPKEVCMSDFKKLHMSEFTPDPIDEECIAFVRYATSKEIRESKRDGYFNDRDIRNALRVVDGEKTV